MAERFDAGLQIGNGAGGEGAQHQRPQAGVAGRFQFQHGVCLDRVERFQVAGNGGGQFRGHFAPEAAILEDHADRGM